MPQYHLADIADRVVQAIRSEKESAAHRKLCEFKGNRRLGQEAFGGSGTATPAAADETVAASPRYSRSHQSGSEVETGPASEQPPWRA